MPWAVWIDPAARGGETLLSISPGQTIQSPAKRRVLETGGHLFEQPAGLLGQGFWTRRRGSDPVWVGPGDDPDLPEWRSLEVVIDGLEQARDDEARPGAPRRGVALDHQTVAGDIGDFDMITEGRIELGFEHAVAGLNLLRYGRESRNAGTGGRNQVTNGDCAAIVHAE